LESYLPHQTAVVITSKGLAVHYCTPYFSKLCMKDEAEILNSNIFELLSEFSDVLRDHLFCKDLLAHTNSFTTLRINWPYLAAEADDTPKTIISHASFEDSGALVKRVFTFSIIEPTITTHSPQQPTDQIETTDQSTQQDAGKTYTGHLIETNVRLRKEIRNHQSALLALKESELRFRNLTETTSDFIWEIDATGQYTYASPKCLDILGYAPEELLGSRYLLLRDPVIAAKFSSQIRKKGSETQNFKDWNYIFKHKNGQEVIMQSSGEPVFKKVRNQFHFSGFRGIDRDITQRVLYEKRLMLAKQAAERANEAKSDFLANMSHELRTPLHAILSYSRYGEKKYPDCPRKDLGHYFNQISKSAQRLFPFIDGLLDLSKLESGKIQYTFCHDDVREEFAQTLAELTPLAQEKQISFKLQDPPFRTMASFDRQRLGQVIRNIISNAVKFSSPGCTIEISFLPDKDLNSCDCLRITITNSGIGIPKNELEAVFDKFYQSSTTRSGAGGTGLGLSICREILNNMHGTIWAESDSGLTSFHFTLPTCKPAEKLGQILIRKGLISEQDLEEALRLQQTRT